MLDSTKKLTILHLLVDLQADLFFITKDNRPVWIVINRNLQSIKKQLEKL